jgi:hypothetical protein
MAMTSTTSNRRGFLRTSLLGGLVTASTWRFSSRAATASDSADKFPSRVALTAGNDRADNVFQGLRAFAREAQRGICR